MNSFRPSDVALWIVTFQRDRSLRQTLKMWLDSFNFEEVHILTNDPAWLDYESLVAGFDVDMRVWPNDFRAPWETGSIAWCWNQAMKHTFLRKDWCLMSQDDVIVEPGWADVVRHNLEYASFIAPHGDVVQLQSVDGFNEVGWFDERFRAIGGPEADYLLRMMRQYPDKLSAHDDHVWYMRHNDVGLADYWHNSPREGEVIRTRQAHNEQFATEECFKRWEEKWPLHVDDLFIQRAYDVPRNPGWEEIDWYPAFTRKMEETGRRTRHPKRPYAGMTGRRG